jgi:thiamine kinase-like enzyme
MATNSAPKRSQIQQLLSRYLYADATVPKADICVEGPVYRGINSCVFKVTSPVLPYPCALKFFLKTRTLEPDLESARQQFVSLQTINSAIRESLHYRVLRPYLLMESEGAILIEWVNGQTVTSALPSLRPNAGRMQTLLKQSAKWLHHFHAAHLLASDYLDTGDRLDNIDRLQKKIRHKGKFYGQCLTLLHKTAQAASAHKLPRSWAFGDFKSDNLILVEGAVFGIDISATTKDLVLFDMAQFLNHIETQSRRWKRPRLGIRKSRLSDIFIKAYLEGSDTTVEQISLPLAWVRLYTLLHSWSKQRLSKNGLFRGWFLENEYRTVAARVVRELEQIYHG